MSKKIFLRIISIFLLIVISLSLVDEIQIYLVTKKNIKIQAEILKMPSCCDCRNIIATFKFKNETFESEVPYYFCKKYKVGDKLLFYHNYKHPKIFVSELYKENSSTKQLFSSCLLILLFAFAFGYSFK